MRALQDRGSLLLVEIMWRRYARKVAEMVGLERILSFCDAPVYLILDMAEDADRVMEALADHMEAGRILDAILAQNERERGDIWRIREDSYAAQRGVSHPLWYDISVPLSELDAYVGALDARLTRMDSRIELYVLGHLGDGNLHLTIARKSPFTAEEHTAISVAVEAGLKIAGGAISAEHGVGVEKLAALGRCIPDGSLAAMRRLKQALDPKGILNPGKVVPPELR